MTIYGCSGGESLSYFSVFEAEPDSRGTSRATISPKLNHLNASEHWRPSCTPFSRAIYHHYRVCDVFGELPRLSGLLDVDALCRQPIDQIVRTGALELGIVGRRGDLYLDRQT